MKNRHDLYHENAGHPLHDECKLGPGNIPEPSYGRLEENQGAPFIAMPVLCHYGRVINRVAFSEVADSFIKLASPVPSLHSAGVSNATTPREAIRQGIVVNASPTALRLPRSPGCRPLPR